MCGIVGFLTSPDSDEFELKTQVCRMADQLVHRGPDDFGMWVDGHAGIALGHRRLSILDLSPDGHQPMQSASGRYAMVFNGEVYNFKILRRQLQSLGHTFRGHSDTEVMLGAIEQWGTEAALQRFNGMFAFAVWDRKERRLQLARDRMGEKPLYYGWMGKTFLFGSELKALHAHSDFQGRINRDALTLYLRYGCIPAPYSVYEDIHKLPPATVLTLKLCDHGTVPAPVPYWSAEEAVSRGILNPFGGSVDEAVTSLDVLLRDAVKLRMVADVPLGAFLSGGVDSSALVALMQAQSAEPVKTFCIGFHEESHNEARHAAAVARHLGTEHTELYVTAEEAMRVIPTLPALYDEPFSDSSQIPTHLVSRLARRHVTVSLSGDGGDELFGGYIRYYIWANIWNMVSWVPHSVRQSMAWSLRRLDRKRWNQVFGLVHSLLPSLLRVRLPGEKVHLLAAFLAARDSQEYYLRLVSNWTSPERVVLGASEPPTIHTDPSHWAGISDLCRRMMFLDSVTYLPDDLLTKVDRASMAVALEVRVPYLDHRVVEFAASLPSSMTVHKWQGKRLLRKLLYRYVPKELIERPKKGFSIPIAAWLRGPLREWAEELLSERRLRSDGYFDPVPIRSLWGEHLADQRNWHHCLWGVLMFQSWLEQWARQAPQEPVSLRSALLEERAT